MKKVAPLKRSRNEFSMIERVRKIGLAVCVVMEVAQATLLVLSAATVSAPSSVADSLLHNAHYLDRASWLAFIALASATFWQTIRVGELGKDDVVEFEISSSGGRHGW
jgi:hypothetical protein